LLSWSIYLIQYYVEFDNKLNPVGSMVLFDKLDYNYERHHTL
ncbi:21699_t:CDS:2, partial [Entrophospora sp. SA101]